MGLHFQAETVHTDRIAYTALPVHYVTTGDYVHDLLAVRYRNGARGIQYSVHVL